MSVYASVAEFCAGIWPERRRVRLSPPHADPKAKCRLRAPEPPLSSFTFCSNTRGKPKAVWWGGERVLSLSGGLSGGMSCVWVFAVCTVMLSIMWQHTRLNTRVGLTKSQNLPQNLRPPLARPRVSKLADLFVFGIYNFAVGPRSPGIAETALYTSTLPLWPTAGARGGGERADDVCVRGPTHARRQVDVHLYG